MSGLTSVRRAHFHRETFRGRRLSNNYSLNEELNEMKRVLKEKIPG